MGLKMERTELHHGKENSVPWAGFVVIRQMVQKLQFFPTEVVPWQLIL